MPYLSASAVVIHYEEALYQVYAPLPLSLPTPEGWLSRPWCKVAPADIRNCNLPITSRALQRTCRPALLVRMYSCVAGRVLGGLRQRSGGPARCRGTHRPTATAATVCRSPAPVQVFLDVVVVDTLDPVVTAAARRRRRHLCGAAGGSRTSLDVQRCVSTRTGCKTLHTQPYYRLLSSVRGTVAAVHPALARNLPETAVISSLPPRAKLQYVLCGPSDNCRALRSMTEDDNVI